MSNDNTARKTTHKMTTDLTDTPISWPVKDGAPIPIYTHRTIPNDWAELTTAGFLTNVQLAERLVRAWNVRELKTTLYVKIEGQVLTYDGQRIEWAVYESQPARHNIEVATYNYQNVTLARKRKEYTILSDIFQSMRAKLKGLIFDDVRTAYENFQNEIKASGDYEHGGIARFSARYYQRVKLAYTVRMATVEKTDRNVPTMAEKAKEAGSQYIATFGEVVA